MENLNKKFVLKLVPIFIIIILIVGAFIFVPKKATKQGKDEEITNDSINAHFCNENAPDWLKMINNSLATLDYFESSLDIMVTDVAVGTRVMEAQMNILLNSTLNLNVTILQDLKELQRKSKLLADTIVQYFKKNLQSPEYSETEGKAKRVEKALYWIKSASYWETPALKQWKTLTTTPSNIKPALHVSLASHFGGFTDACIFSTFENCTIPDFCVEFLWKKTHSGYLLTHQILFHYMVQQNNCYSQNKILYESLNLPEPSQFLETLCRAVLPEAMYFESLDYPAEIQDLFVEQIMVCSLAGFNDLLTQNWTNAILSWEGDDGILGCYSEKSMAAFQATYEPHRVKRWDNLFESGTKICSPHMGALILGVIGQQLRYFLETCYDV